jgi:hypothetical protein
MNREIDMSCRCGTLQGRVNAESASVINRAVCYCRDCQAFLHWLQRPDLLDAQAGSDIVQVAPSSLRFERGHEQIRSVRLSRNGLYRWYASCCNSPVGNTLRPSIPFVGVLIHAFPGGPSAADTVFGPSRGSAFGEHATGALPADAQRFPIGMMVRALARVLGVRLRGETWPHPFFARDGQPLYPVQVLDPAERDALRPLCGRAATAS